jgi:hypothetical protein
MCSPLQPLKKENELNIKRGLPVSSMNAFAKNTPRHVAHELRELGKRERED